jgi:hypothetical protein
VEADFNIAMSGYSDFPNLQKSIETNVPVISSIIMSFLTGLFVALATSENKILSSPVVLRVYEWYHIQIPLSKSGVAMILSGSAAMCFLFSVMYSMKAQASDYDALPENKKPKQVPDIIQSYFRESTIYFTKWSLVAFNMGLAIFPLVLLPFIKEDYNVLFLVLLLVFYSYSLFNRRKLPIA